MSESRIDNLKSENSRLRAEIEKRNTSIAKTGGLLVIAAAVFLGGICIHTAAPYIDRARNKANAEAARIRRAKERADYWAAKQAQEERDYRTSILMDRVLANQERLESGEGNIFERLVRDEAIERELAGW